jgi:biotin carboxyl carrier protein
MLKRGLLILVPLVLAVALVWGYLQRRSEFAEQREREAPVRAAAAVRSVEGEAGIVLDTALVSRLGVEAMALQTARAGVELRLTGEIVPDPQGTSSIRAPVSGRLSASGRPWPRFGERVVAGEEVAQVSDTRALTVPRSGEVIRVLAQPGELVQAGQELLVIADYEHPLARLAWRDEAPTSPPHELRVAQVGHEQLRVVADLVGSAPDADPVTRRPAYLYRVRQGWPDVRPGTAVLGFIASGVGSTSGVFVPADAVVQWEGLAWVFVEREPGRYVRNSIATDRPVPGGWVVQGGVKAGERVVTRGAAQLLSEEFRARIVVGEENEE